jgi:hypothetical protein
VESWDCGSATSGSGSSLGVAIFLVPNRDYELSILRGRWARLGKFEGLFYFLMWIEISWYFMALGIGSLFILSLRLSWDTMLSLSIMVDDFSLFKISKVINS